MKSEVAIITGSGRGIGAATALSLAKRGCSLVLTSRTQEELDQVKAEVSKISTVPVEVLAGDISDPTHVGAVFDKAECLGGVSILVNNAAFIRVQDFIEVTPEIWDETFNVNVRALYFTCREAFQRMKLNGKKGSIINISSLGGIKGTLKFKGFTPYSVSKFAVTGLTECLAVEGKELGIRVNCIAPGAVNTRMLKEAAPFLSTSTNPNDIANVITYLCDSSVSGAVNGAVIEIHSND